MNRWLTRKKDKKVTRLSRAAPAGPGIVATGEAQRNPWNGNPYYPSRPGRGEGEIPPPLPGRTCKMIVYHGLRFASPVATVRRPIRGDMSRCDLATWEL